MSKALMVAGIAGQGAACLADMHLFLRRLPNERLMPLLGSDEASTGPFEPPLVNISAGQDVAIAKLAEVLRSAVSYRGSISRPMVINPILSGGTSRTLVSSERLNAVGCLAKASLAWDTSAASQGFQRSSS